MVARLKEIANEVLKLKLDSIDPSEHNPRRHFDEEKLEELAGSIRALGVLEPILVRAKDDGRYELIAGERRYRAARIAGVAWVPAIVRNDADATVEAIRLVENLQREDLTPCETADHYVRLVTVHGKTVDEIAEKVGVTKRSIEQTMRLARLGGAARRLIDNGVVDKTIAMRAASIPNEELQEKFLKEVANGGDLRWSNRSPLTFREAERWLANNYQRSLSGAPFSTKDAKLVVEAGSCKACPKNTSNFPKEDGAAKNMCTDLACWDLKREADWQARATKAKAAGHTVLTKTEAEKVFNNWSGDNVKSDAPYIDLDARCDRDPLTRPPHYKPGRTWRELLGESVPAVHVLARDHENRIHQLLPKREAQKLLRKALPPEHKKAKTATPAAATALRQRSVDHQRREDAFREIADELHSVFAMASDAELLQVVLRKVIQFAIEDLIETIGDYDAVASLILARKLFVGKEQVSAKGFELEDADMGDLAEGFVRELPNLELRMLLSAWAELVCSDWRHSLRPEYTTTPLHRLGATLDIDVAAIVERVWSENSEPQGKKVPATHESGTCRACGCQDEMACPGGCSWVDAAHTLCSECDDLLTPELIDDFAKRRLKALALPSAKKAALALGELARDVEDAKAISVSAVNDGARKAPDHVEDENTAPKAALREIPTREPRKKVTSAETPAPKVRITVAQQSTLAHLDRGGDLRREITRGKPKIWLTPGAAAVRPETLDKLLGEGWIQLDDSKTDAPGTKHRIEVYALTESGREVLQNSRV